MPKVGSDPKHVELTRVVQDASMAHRERVSDLHTDPLTWSMTTSDIGTVLAVASARGLVAVRIGADETALEREMEEEFVRASLRRAGDAMAGYLAALQTHALTGRVTDLPLDPRGTRFQMEVWSALGEIPAGQTRTYAQVAASVGKPAGARAVASACASNPIALAIPCHRVMRGDGSLAGYAWGIEVKRRLLALEAHQQAA